MKLIIHFIFATINSLCHPIDDVVLEHAFIKLVEKIRSKAVEDIAQR